MLKKVLLMIAVMILAFSCSKTPTDPNNGGTGNTGDGGIIDEGSGTSNPTTIADFLNKHTGRYYVEYNDGSQNVEYVIDGGKIYNYNNAEVSGTSTLLEKENKLQIYVYGSTEPYSERNDRIYIFNFYDNSIKLYEKYVYQKEAFNKPNELVQIQKVNGLSIHEGNYYTWNSGSSQNEYIKNYSFAIDKDGYIYGDQGMKDVNPTLQLKGNILEMSYQTKFEDGLTHSIKASLIFKNNVMIEGDAYIDGKTDDYYRDLKKSDLFNDYIGTYLSEDGLSTFTINNNNAYIDGTTKVNGTSILLGKNMTIHEYIYQEGQPSIKKHTIVFSDDKQTATYTNPDTQEKTTFTRQGA